VQASGSVGWTVPVPRLQAGKRFFSEEKKQKTFVISGTRLSHRARQTIKVFWFFFSKKNALPASDHQR
jgi:hypothetical protein